MSFYDPGALFFLVFFLGKTLGLCLNHFFAFIFGNTIFLFLQFLLYFSFEIKEFREKISNI